MTMTRDFSQETEPGGAHGTVNQEITPRPLLKASASFAQQHLMPATDQ